MKAAFDIVDSAKFDEDVVLNYFVSLYDAETYTENPAASLRLASARVTSASDALSAAATRVPGRKLHSRHRRPDGREMTTPVVEDHARGDGIKPIVPSSQGNPAIVKSVDGCLSGAEARMIAMREDTRT